MHGSVQQLAKPCATSYVAVRNIIHGSVQHHSLPPIHTPTRSSASEKRSPYVRGPPTPDNLSCATQWCSGAKVCEQHNSISEYSTTTLCNINAVHQRQAVQWYIRGRRYGGTSEAGGTVVHQRQAVRWYTRGRRYAFTRNPGRSFTRSVSGMAWSCGAGRCCCCCCRGGGGEGGETWWYKH